MKNVKMKTYVVHCSWTLKSFYEIEAKTRGQARQKIKEAFLPMNGFISHDSFTIEKINRVKS